MDNMDEFTTSIGIYDKTDDREASNQSMKPTAPFRNQFSELATAPCRGLSLSR
jgi:hypothetical protein